MATAAERMARIETNADHTAKTLEAMQRDMRADRDQAKAHRDELLQRVEVLSQTIAAWDNRIQGGRLAIAALVFVGGVLGSVATWIFKAFAGVMPR